jgi:hypothetical protein
MKKVDEDVQYSIMKLFEYIIIGLNIFPNEEIDILLSYIETDFKIGYIICLSLKNLISFNKLIEKRIASFELFDILEGLLVLHFDKLDKKYLDLILNILLSLLLGENKSKLISFKEKNLVFIKKLVLKNFENSDLIKIYQLINN